ncbi:hypothetical protein DH2020_042496 [Rehmannia glutinosa]|uniref:Protein kinase domain-containing protein n=1 Tax=Rehmannia glutinosa TaxID=99300 RepID=A0ABR0UP95_REHGL
MGCVLGKRGRETRRKPENDERRHSEPAAVTLQNDVVERAKEQKIGQVPVAADGRRSLTATEPEFRLRTSVSAAAGVSWPSWLVDVAGNVINDWKPRLANTFEKLDKIGQGTYSNVYKARDLITGKVVALKKVRFDNFEPETVRFMAREILVLRRLNHPNVIKLEGLVISRMSSSLYLVFEYMEHDLAGLAAVQSVKFTEPLVKCYMKQLLSGLEHCHNNGVLHRDIKCSNLLIDNEGILKIADFGLASFFDPERKKPMTSRVVTLWYRPPELLLGATCYGVGVDLWSAGCILAELFAGKPIMRGRTEVEQLHKIFKLCGSPTEEYWKKCRLPNATLYKPQQPYKRCIKETFKDFPPSSLALIETLLTIDPDARGTATAALNSEPSKLFIALKMKIRSLLEFDDPPPEYGFLVDVRKKIKSTLWVYVFEWRYELMFCTTEPYACEPSNLPKFPPSKEMDIKLRDEEARRQRGLVGKSHTTDGHRKARGVICLFCVHSSIINTILYLLQRLRIMSHAKGKGEKFPPPHQDGSVVHHPPVASQNGTSSFGGAYNSFNSSVFDPKSSRSLRNGTLKTAASRSKNINEEPHRARLGDSSMHSIRPPLVGRWISGSIEDEL